MSHIFAVFVALLLNLVFAFMSSRETLFWLRLRPLCVLSRLSFS
jgi:hypothetical protein